MSDPLLASILSSQGEGGANSNSVQNAGTELLGSNNSPSTDYSNVMNSNATSSLSSANSSLAGSNTNLANAEIGRDTVLNNAMSGNASPAQAISADNTLSAASLGNQQSQESYLQYATNIPNQTNLGVNSPANSMLYNGDSLTKPATSVVRNNIPGGAGSTFKSISSLTKSKSASGSTQDVPSDRRIRLRPKGGIKKFVGNSSLLKPLIDTNGLMFPFTPTITVTRQAKYQDVTTIHNIQDYKSYSGTSAIKIGIQGTFTAQNIDEAYFLLACYHFMRACTLMSFGQDSLGVAPPGTPPPVLLLSGYGSYNFNDLPVIVENATMDYPVDVDYITVKVGTTETNLPVKTSISVDCYVQNTPSKLRKFDWGKYVNGSLMNQKGWF